MPPFILACHNPLCAEYRSVHRFVLNGLQRIFQLFLRKLLRRFQSPARKHVVRMVVTVLVMMLVIMMIMVAATMGIVTFVATMSVFMMVFMVMLVLVVIMLMMMFVFMVMVVIILVMMPTATMFMLVVLVMVFVVMMLVVVFVLFFQRVDIRLQAVLAFDCRKQGLAVELRPFRRDDGSRKILFTEQVHRRIQLFRRAF